MNTKLNNALLLEKTYGFRLPEAMREEFNLGAAKHGLSHPVSTDELNNFFCKEYIENSVPFEITSINFEKEFINTNKERLRCHVSIKHNNQVKEVEGIGNGTLNALAGAFQREYGIEVEVNDYLQHGLTQGSHALAASYILIETKNGKHFWGVGLDTDSTLSAIRAFLSAVNRSV